MRFAPGTELSADVRSSVGVVAPSFSVTSYSFSRDRSDSLNLVHFPIKTNKTPVANGSSVPACPTFVPGGRRRFTRPTSRADDGPGA